ncbi:PHD finger protein 6 [Scomber scombrus]|uniref:PHD finger protein 6 n=1 Tax=Scomber scombrus TaxID=13677 RepID=UPI002DDB0944|nr:PHD finger protein 6 [Scomber scombrus]
MVEMGNDRKVICILCERSEETKISGALSTKDYITAHQNCLLFSSGIYCQNSPQFDDLFGFSVDDVMDEVKRGSKLVCYQCKKKGATAGCEVKRCKKSFHYPCAVQEGAHIIEDANEGKYGLFCFSHYQKQRNKSSTDEHDFTKLQTSKKSSKTASSKVFCLSCEKTEGNISLDSLSNRIIMLNCNKHAPPSHKKNGYDDSVAAGPSACSSDSSSASSPVSSKRKLNINDKEEERPSKRKPEGWKRRLSDNSSDSVENEPNTDMAMFAPLESDLDENANSVPENQEIS